MSRLESWMNSAVADAAASLSAFCCAVGPFLILPRWYREVVLRICWSGDGDGLGSSFVTRIFTLG
jgi:hypothetical protein